MTQKKSFPLQAWLIIGIPVLGILLMYWALPDNQDDRDSLITTLGTTNHGTLIYPAIDASAAQWLGTDGTYLEFGGQNTRWKLIVLADGRCHDACQKSLYITAQIHKLIPKRMNRIERLYVSANALENDISAQLSAAYPGLLVVEGAMTELLAANGNVPLERDDVFYLMDSKGQIVMYYHSEHDYKKIIKDLKVLL